MPPRPGHGVELTTRSDAAELPALRPGPGGKSITPRFQELLVGEADGDAWRIVEVFSRSGRPFEVELAWSAGTGTGAQARLTVSHAVRVCVFARSVRLAAANLSSEDNRVAVTVGDGFAVTRNHLAVAGQGVGPIDVPVPAFATHVHLDVADAALRAASTLTLLDGQTVPRAAVTAATQGGSDGVALAGAQLVRVSLPSPAAWRLVFTLCL